MDRRSLLVAGSAGLLFPGARRAAAAELTSARVETGDALDMLRPDWPVPDDRHQVLFLQRSMNANTMVFTARFDTAGQLLKSAPMQVYWRRYAEAGQRKELNLFERLLVVSMKATPRPDGSGIDIRMRQLPQLPLLLAQVAPGKAELLGYVGGAAARLVYMFAIVDESGLIPRVTELSVHGYRLADGLAASEFFAVDGGLVQ